MLTGGSDRASALSKAIVDWAKELRSIRGLALVGSHARHQARPDSDIDLVLLVDNPNDFRRAAWLSDVA
jgi:predicted nucleotidyltransferase